MEELQDIMSKYESAEIPAVGSDLDELRKFSTMFFSDVAELYDIITRITNTDRNPTGFSVEDAPILGLLVKVSKLLREIAAYYDANDANIISYLARQAIEAGVVARYLLSSSSETIENYRKCSYKDRLKMFEATENQGFYTTKAGKRLKASIEEKLKVEGFDPTSFETQKKQSWKVDGKSVRDMFTALGVGALYEPVYGFGSESIHASWGHSINFDLRRNGDGTYSAFPIEMPVDIRLVGPVIIFCNPAFIGWSKRVELNQNEVLLKWIDDVNRKLCEAFDAAYPPIDG